MVGLLISSQLLVFDLHCANREETTRSMRSQPSQNQSWAAIPLAIEGPAGV
jgi:hypothetical protein